MRVLRAYLCFFLSENEKRERQERKTAKYHLYEKILTPSSTVNKIVITMLLSAKNWKEEDIDISTQLENKNKQDEKRGQETDIVRDAHPCQAYYLN